LTTLILGFGNPDRQDDGVAWHILNQLMQRYGLPITSELDINYYDLKTDIAFLFQLQLIPEIAYDLDRFEKAVFIDAHTGAVTEEIHIEQIEPTYRNSPLTHHLTTGSLLAISKKLHKKVPISILVSVRGYEFKFSQNLSKATENLVNKAADLIFNWIGVNNQSPD
jgi:hydrogenase maturation protease